MVDLDAVQFVGVLKDQPVNVRIWAMVLTDLIDNKPRHTSERGQVKSAWFIKHYVSAKISKFTAKIAPERVLLLCIKGVDDILARRRGIFIKAFHFGRRVLQIVIHGNDMLAFRGPQPS